MLISNKILRGKLPTNAIYNISLKEIINSNLWTPGDFMPNVSDDCLTQYEYHVCGPVYQRWDNTLQVKMQEWRYLRILKSIKEKGFVVPIAAKIGFDEKHIVVVDGQHRIAAALGLDIATVDVYIGDSSRQTRELRALDSNYWSQGNPDSPWYEEYLDGNAAEAAAA